jgi:hydroxymethylbilane synthase
LNQAQVLKLGTRGSQLALAQAQAVADAIGDAEVIPVASTDSEPGDKERFVRGVERALLAGEVDLGVHSTDRTSSASPASRGARIRSTRTWERRPR